VVNAYAREASSASSRGLSQSKNRRSAGSECGQRPGAGAEPTTVVRRRSFDASNRSHRRLIRGSQSASMAAVFHVTVPLATV
jgi:hypothetical protein